MNPARLLVLDLARETATSIADIAPGWAEAGLELRAPPKPIRNGREADQACQRFFGAGRGQFAHRTLVLASLGAKSVHRQTSRWDNVRVLTVDCGGVTRDLLLKLALHAAAQWEREVSMKK